MGGIERQERGWDRETRAGVKVKRKGQGWEREIERERERERGFYYAVDCSSLTTEKI